MMDRWIEAMPLAMIVGTIACAAVSIWFGGLSE